MTATRLNPYTNPQMLFSGMYSSGSGSYLDIPYNPPSSNARDTLLLLVSPNNDTTGYLAVFHVNNAGTSVPGYTYTNSGGGSSTSLSVVTVNGQKFLRFNSGNWVTAIAISAHGRIRK